VAEVWSTRSRRLKTFPKNKARFIVAVYLWRHYAASYSEGRQTRVAGGGSWSPHLAPRSAVEAPWDGHGFGYDY